ncbi:NAD(P)-dependent oxidoreductase [Macrococcus hajekii]|uniref:NAD(P)-dependent oxidoreductase n=1 Tax=Macrococcus hajekii TaxID=198482 RepID=A0A4R6BNR6_9STAP|nr:NmrA family NAD(P)-binding protein [Macrococcus hajekii]TDM03362.1 NAD(P)-dependent oxidoreductase [Macrococcus hajekii]GGA98244.1 hypothetical protein GCM10007190_02800 [Macrococcus hajekii]
MEIFITGAAGHTGMFFLNYLSHSDIQISKIKCLVRPTTKITELNKFKQLPIEIVSGDITDLNFLKEVTRNTDVIINIANIRFTPLLQNAAISNKVDWLIAVHTTGRYSQFKSASAEYIEIEDKLLNDRKMNLTIIRPTMIYGSMKDHNMSKLIKFLDRNKFFPVFGNGENLLQPVRAQDLGKALYDILNNPNQTKNKEYNLSGLDKVSYNQIISLITQQLNKNTKIIHLPIKLSYQLAKLGQKFIPKFPIKDEQVLRMQEDKVFSHEEASKDFGYSPMAFKDGISFQIDEYKKSRSSKND